MRRVARWGIPITAILLVVIYVAVSYLITSGVTKAERKEQEDHPSAYGLQFEDVEFVSRKGDVNLKGWYMSDEDPGPSLIFVHGIGSIRTGDNATKLAARLVERGFSVLLFDLRAHGDSEGEKVSGGYHERLDVLGAFDFLTERGVPSGRIGVLGNSMGAGTSVLALADEPRIRALVADSSYANASEFIASETARKTFFPEWLVPVFIPGAKLAANVLFEIDIGAMVPEEAVTHLDYPIMVIHGTSDTRIPVENGERVHKAAHPESELWLLSEVEHMDAFITYPDEYVQRVASYFGQRLGGQ